MASARRQKKEGLRIMNFNKIKFMVVTTILFLIPFSILSFHFIVGNNKLVKKDTLSYLELKARTFSKTVSDLLNLNYDIHRIVRQRGFLNASWDGRKQLLEKKLKERPDVYVCFYLLDASGRIVRKMGVDYPNVSSVGRTQIDKDKGKVEVKDYSKMEIFRAAISQKQSIGVVEYSLNFPPVLMLTEIIAKSHDAKPEGVVLTKLNLVSLNDIVRSASRSLTNEEIGIIDAGGLVIADSLGKSIISPGAKISQDVLVLTNQCEKMGLSDLRSEMMVKKERYLVAVSNVPGIKWWVYNRVKLKHVLSYSSAYWVRRVVLSGVVLIIIFGIITEKLASFWLLPRH
jgi:hypothetical protein